MSYFLEKEFTAQSHIVEALMNMYRALDDVEEPEVFELTPIPVFLAFAIEAYLNGIGFRKVNFWESVERNNWRQKVEILHSISGKAPDWGKEPLTFTVEVFRLRDRLAHGKPDILQYGPHLDFGAAGDSYNNAPDEPEWYKHFNKKWIVKSEKMFHLTMQYFAQLFGLPNYDHLILESTKVVQHKSANKSLSRSRR